MENRPDVSAEVICSAVSPIKEDLLIEAQAMYLGWVIAAKLLLKLVIGVFVVGGGLRLAAAAGSRLWRECKKLFPQRAAK